MSVVFLRLLPVSFTSDVFYVLLRDFYMPIFFMHFLYLYVLLQICVINK